MLEKQFEEFLVAHFNQWATNEIKVGFRYQFTCPDEEKGYKLYQAFIKESQSHINVKGIDLPTIKYGDVELIPVYEGENFTENYIAHLRDEVSALEGETKGSALLVIHNSLLDTLKNSTEDVAQQGAVWHPQKIKQLLHGLIDQKCDLAQISECLLDVSFEEILEDGATMFGFEKLYYAIADGDLRVEETGRLPDEQLNKGTWDNKEAIRERLEDNRKLSEKLDFITHHYPNELEDKLAALDFSEKFVREHFPKDDVERYKTSLDLEECFAEQRKNRTELLELENIKAPHLECVTKTRTESGAGLRENHILLLLEAEQNAFELDLSFIKHKLKDSYCSVQHDNYEQKAVVTIKNLGGVRSRAIVTGSFNGQARYIAVQVKTAKPKETHKFKILVLRKGDFFEEGFKHNFLIEPDKKKQYITLQTDDNSLQIAEEGNAATVQENEQCFSNQEFATVDYKKLASESDEVCFTVQGKETKLTFNLEGEVSTDSLTLPLLLDQGRFNHLFEDDYYGQFNRSKNKVQIDGKEIAPKAKRLTLLQYEAELIDSAILSKQSNGQTRLHDIEGIYKELFLAYRDLFDYLQKNKTLVSLAGWGSELRQIISKVVAVYQSEINQIPFNAPLSEAQKTLVNIGFAEFAEQEYITPLHPLVLAYNTNLASVLAEDKESSGSFKKLPPVTINRLSAQGLMPFVYDAKHDFSYNHSEKENVFWSKLIPQQESSYDFVRNLVKDKVNKFTAAFKHLFVAGNKTTLIINSVNNQQNKEVFLGLIDYIKLKKDKVTNIHVNLYDEAESYCWFDKFADTASYDELKELCELNKGPAKTQADSIIDLLRTRLTYSKFTHDKGEKAQAYAHMSFFKNNERVQATDVDVLQQKTGVACHGLMPGEAATNKNDRYYTAFGLNGIDTSEAPQLELIAKYSGLVKPARSQHEEYNASRSQALVVTEEFKTLLERSYENSIWTTIIDPKVTLEFFENQKNMVLIHYSDNYTNSVNYDAITVTKQTGLYSKVLESDNGGIIEEFNAFNGEWLLNLVTANDNERKEKRGIICAYKYVNCLLAKSDITWVPLSIAEVIRVASNLGLNMADSDLSRLAQGFKKGVISDDILFVGFKEQQIILLPVEVKTGKRQTHSKGVKQAQELKSYFESLLGQQTLAGHLYRGLFMRQVLMQIDKYKLYNVYKHDYFDVIEDNSAYWLQGDYQLAELTDYPAGLLFVNVEDSYFAQAKFTLESNILKIELPAACLSHWVKTPMQTLFAELTPAKLHHIDERYILNEKTTVNLLSEVHKVAEPATKQQATVDLKASNTNQNEEAENKSSGEELQSNEHLKVLVGHELSQNTPVYWEPTNTAKFMNTNSGIIGTMGTGKTQCTKSVVTQLYRNQQNNVDGKPIGILIFDYKSDYVDDKFLNATNGKSFNLDCLPYNPLSLFGNKPKLPVHTASAFATTMTKAFGLGPKQQTKLKNLILEAYQNVGIDRSDKTTWNIPAPTLSDLWDLYLEQEKVEQDSLYAALDNLVSFEVFEPCANKVKSLYDLVDGVTVIELAGYDTSIQNLVVALTLDLFYSQMQKQGKPGVLGDFRQVTKLVLVDEADNFMSQNFASLRKILKEGREYGVGVILSTQDITHFKTGENDYSSYILSWIVHRVAQIKNQDIKSIFNVDDKQEQERLMKYIRELEKHTSLYIDGKKSIRNIKDKAFWELI